MFLERTRKPGGCKEEWFSCFLSTGPFLARYGKAALESGTCSVKGWHSSLWFTPRWCWCWKELAELQTTVNWESNADNGEPAKGSMVKRCTCSLHSGSLSNRQIVPATPCSLYLSISLLPNGLSIW